MHNIGTKEKGEAVFIPELGQWIGAIASHNDNRCSGLVRFVSRRFAGYRLGACPWPCSWERYRACLCCITPDYIMNNEALMAGPRLFRPVYNLRRSDIS